VGRKPTRLTLELVNDVGAIGHAVEYLTQVCAVSCTDLSRLRLNFRVGLTEALSNAMLYGNKADPQKKVQVEVSFEGGHIRVQVTDEGLGFDPSVVPDPTTPENLTRTGGRGIFLMRSLMDEVRFNDLGNSVTLVLRDLTRAARQEHA